jgi:hypothetical protein
LTSSAESLAETRFSSEATGRRQQECDLFTEREFALAIQFLRRRLQAAENEGKSRALVEALRETLAEFEAGRMPHRYPVAPSRDR